MSVSQPGTACKQPFPQSTEQSHSWDISRRPIGADHSVVTALLPRTLAPQQLLTSACSQRMGAGAAAQQGLGSSVFHTKPTHSHPEQLSQAVEFAVRFLQREAVVQPKLDMPGNGLLVGSMSRDQSSPPTKHAFGSFVLVFKVYSLPAWRILRGRCTGGEREASMSDAGQFLPQASRTLVGPCSMMLC